MEKEKRDYRGHVLVLPYPAQGHINPMLEFSKRLVSRGVKATLVNTKFMNKSMHVDPNNPIDVEAISDGYDDGGLNSAESIELYLTSFQVVGSKTLSELITRVNKSSQPVTGLVYDGFMPWGLDVAKKFGILGVVFFTQSCAVNTVYYLVQRGLLPLPLNEPTVSLPGLPVLEASETPSFISDYGSYPAFYHMVVNQFINIDDVDWVLFNTFYDLEKEGLDWLTKKWRVATIGPTLPSMYLDKRLEDDKDYSLNLWEPNTSTCMDWLRNKPNGSVVYVSFGSMAEVGKLQMEELALGLKSSNCYFLWVVRASEEAKLPTDFANGVSEKGLLVNWCPQLDVLTHGSVGCFVTHCGFNSVLEAMSLGVPMVAIPQWTDQLTNAKFVEDVWKVGIRARPDEAGIARRGVIEACVKQVLEGEKGKEMKENAKKWGNLATKAVDEGGSSDRCINEFVASLIGSN